MKTKIALTVLGSIFSFSEGPLHAQISESESSVTVLAVQCSVSSGFSSSDFDDYSRRLAKTLALLSPDQQTRVFGYLPQPNGAMAGRNKGLSAPAGPNFADGNREEQPESSAASVVVPESAPSVLDGLVGMVGDFNNALSGKGGSSPDPIYAGREIEANAKVVGNQIAAAASGGVSKDSLHDSAPLNADQETNSAVEGSPDSAADAKKQNSLSTFLSWLKEAEAAYEAGTLKEFLKM